MTIPSRSDVTTMLTGMLLLVAIALAYWPGLKGGFVFDDFANLDVLGAFGDVWRWPHFAYYLTSGHADPTGRPIALLTFLLDGNSWPTDPWPFKRTNLALHLLNTFLLAWATTQLHAAWQRRTPEVRTSHWVPLLAATLWGAHPFFVSTTLYIVQREAMLPMSFMLLALLAWMRGMSRLESGFAVSAWAWVVVGFGLATLLGGFSKANGFLAPLMVAVCHFYFLRPSADAPHRRQSDLAASVFLGLPTLVILLYLLNVGWQLWGIPQVSGRDWSLSERLLSQPRALWDYLLRLALPRAGGGGVFVEGFAASRGWWQPISTTPALVGLIATSLAAVALRKRGRLASFAWFFFLGAHLLESTTIPLELYFEHRNYLPAVFLGWPVAHLLLRPGLQRRARIAFAVALTAGLLLLTHQRATVWGDAAMMSALSASHETDSARAQVTAAHSDLDRGDAASAVARIRRALDDNPRSIDVAINAIGTECQALGKLDDKTLRQAQVALATARRWNYGLYIWLREAAWHKRMRECQGFGTAGVESLVVHAEANPLSQAPARQRDLKHVRGQIALARNDTDDALRWFDLALQLAPEAPYALVQAAALGDAGDPELALQHLDRFHELETQRSEIPVRSVPGLHFWLLQHYGFYDSELSDLRSRLKADADTRKGSPRPDRTP